MKTPNYLPDVRDMLAVMPWTDRQIARHLGISLRSVQRYRRKDGAPRAVQIALSGETHWRWSAADADPYNWAQIQRAGWQSAQRQIDVLRQQIAVLESAGFNGAANSPVFAIGRNSAARMRGPASRCDAAFLRG